jgi:hypothetical protein
VAVEGTVHDGAAAEDLVFIVAAVVAEAAGDGDADLEVVLVGVKRSQTGFERSEVGDRGVASGGSALAVGAGAHEGEDEEGGGGSDELHGRSMGWGA